MAYDAWGDMAKRLPPGMSGNATLPAFVAQADLNWARPTGNVRSEIAMLNGSGLTHLWAKVYSTVSDMAKFASLFLVGRGEEQNALGIYSSSLREMLSPAFINDDQVILNASSTSRGQALPHTHFQATGYGFPFEIHHSSAYGENLPDYWLRIKGGMMPGYWTLLTLVPEMKTGSGPHWRFNGPYVLTIDVTMAAMIVMANSPVPEAWDAVAALLPAMEQSLWDLQPLPKNPGNLTAYGGTYLASALFGYSFPHHTP
jgi:hypothetical protein